MPPRQWVQAVAGPHYVELNEADICSGSAGSYNLKEPEMAARLQLRKTTHIRQSKAFLVITTNPGCILQIQSELKKEGLGSVRVMHLADYLKMALRHLPSEMARRYAFTKASKPVHRQRQEQVDNLPVLACRLPE